MRFEIGTIFIAVLSASALAVAQPASQPGLNLHPSAAPTGNEKDDSELVQRAIDRSSRGGVITFGPGIYNFGKTLVFRSGRTYRASPQTVLRFHLPKGIYGIAVEGNASNVIIDGFKLEGGGIRLTDGARYSNIRIINNDISACSEETRGVYVTLPNDGLVIEGNLFRDYNEWGVIIYHMNRGSLSRNMFRNVVQGAHIMNPYDDVTVSFNAGRGLHRMGLEIQQFTDKGRPARNLTIEGNVFIEWRRPFWDSFGLSIVPQNGFDVRIVNNYLVATHKGPWGPADNSGVHRYGYGIEAGFTTGVVENNVVAGPWANHVTVSMPDTPVRNNHFFGTPQWGPHIAGEPGLLGHGSAIEENNSVEPDIQRVPGVPSRLPAHFDE